MFYFKKLDNYSKFIASLINHTEKILPLFSIYQEGFYFKNYGRFLHLLYENGKEIESISNSNIRSHFYGVVIKINQKCYLFGIITWDILIVLTLVTSVVLDFVYPVGASFGALIISLILVAFSFKDLKAVKDFLDLLLTLQ